MPITENQARTITRLDDFFQRKDGLREVLLTLDGYKHWYSRLLGTLVLLAGEDEIVFGQATLRHAGSVVEFGLVTTSTIIRATATDLQSETPTTAARAVSRHSITALSVDITETFEPDRWGRPSLRWPGTVTINAEYQGMVEPLVTRGPGFDRYDLRQKPEMLVLLGSLRADLSLHQS